MAFINFNYEKFLDTYHIHNYRKIIEFPIEKNITIYIPQCNLLDQEILIDIFLFYRCSQVHGDGAKGGQHPPL